MKNPRWLKPILFLILISQVIYALIVGPLIHKTDSFPFHQWALFAKVYRAEVLPIIYIKKMGTKIFNPAISYYDTIPMRGPVDFLVAHDNLTTWHQLEQLGQKEKASEMQKSIELQIWGTGYDVEYEIRVVRIDLIDFIKRREVKENLQTFGPYVLQEGRGPQ